MAFCLYKDNSHITVPELTYCLTSSHKYLLNIYFRILPSSPNPIKFKLIIPPSSYLSSTPLFPCQSFPFLPLLIYSCLFFFFHLSLSFFSSWSSYFSYFFVLSLYLIMASHLFFIVQIQTIGVIFFLCESIGIKY